MPCEALESGALSDAAFPAFAKRVVPFLHVTTHIPGEKYDGLLKEKGGRGFPTLLFLDQDGEVLARQGERSVAAFEATLKQVQGYLDLRRRAAAGEAGLDAAVLVAELRLGRVGFEDARSRAAALQKVSADQRAELDQLLLDAEVRGILENMPREAEKQAAAGKRLAEIAASGRLPTSEVQRGFWAFLSRYAADQKDAALLESCIQNLRQILPDDERARQYLANLEAKLQELRQGAQG